jgi:hypothetical protein
VAAGGTTADRDTLGSAITDTVGLFNVQQGLATVSGGAYTVQGGGYNFDTFMGRVAGDSVA